VRSSLLVVLVLLAVFPSGRPWWRGEHGGQRGELQFWKEAGHAVGTSELCLVAFGIVLSGGGSKVLRQAGGAEAGVFKK
jgi:hypothetical protein